MISIIRKYCYKNNVLIDNFNKFYELKSSKDKIEYPKFMMKSVDNNSNIKFLIVPYNSSIKSNDNIEKINKTMNFDEHKNLFFIDNSSINALSNTNNLIFNNNLLCNNINLSLLKEMHELAYAEEIKYTKFVDTILNILNYKVKIRQLPRDMLLILCYNILKKKDNNYFIGIPEILLRINVCKYATKAELSKSFYDYFTVKYELEKELKYNTSPNIQNIIRHNLDKFNYNSSTSFINAIYLQSIINNIITNNDLNKHNYNIIIDTHIYMTYSSLLDIKMESDSKLSDFNTAFEKKDNIDTIIFKLAIQEIINDTSLLLNNNIIKNFDNLNLNIHYNDFLHKYHTEYERIIYVRDKIKNKIFNFEKKMEEDEIYNYFSLDPEEEKEEELFKETSKEYKQYKKFHDKIFYNN